MKMKPGFVSAILPDLSFEEVVDHAADCGYSYVEICCWPVGKAERRYAGVTHIDIDKLDEARKNEILDYTREKGVEISALGYYPNPMDPDPEKRTVYAEHLTKLIDAADFLGIGKINTFVGRDKNKSIDENFELFSEIWQPLVQHAESKKVKIGIENCPMIFTADEWPGGNNLAISPVIWRRMFNEIKSDYFGLNYDPSHLLWMQMDYIKPLYEFKDKLFHIHLKDVRVYQDKLDEAGIMAAPLDFHTPKLVGLGDIDWGAFISALHDVGYEGALCVEVEDRAFEHSLEGRKYSLALCKRFLDQYI